MNDIEIIRTALFAFASAPEQFFIDNSKKFIAANEALNRIESKEKDGGKE